MQTTNIEQLTINRLSQEQYDAAKEAGTLNENELYLTPAIGGGGGAVSSVNGKTGAVVLTASDVNAIPTTQKGEANGVATLGSDGKLTPSQAPESSSAEIFSKTLTTSGWTMGSDGRYKQDVSVTGVTTSTKIITVDVDLTTNDMDAKVEYLTAWAGPSANEVSQGSGKITFYTYEKPTVAIPVFVGVTN